MLDVWTTFLRSWQEQCFSDLILLTKCRLPLQEEMNCSLEMFCFPTTEGVQRAASQQTNPTLSVLGITPYLISLLRSHQLGVSAT